MIMLSPADSVFFLLEFVNEKEWTKESFRQFQIHHHLISSKYGEEHGYEETVFLRKFNGKRFFVCEKTNTFYLDFCTLCGNDKSVIEKTVIPEIDFFSTLVELQASWRAFLLMTRESGHNLEFLNEICKVVTWQLVNTTSFFSPRVGTFSFDASTIEDFLEFNYLNAASQFGDFVNRLRLCENPHCGNLYVYNLNKQKFCDTPCRYKYHNTNNISDCSLARYQAKGRKEKPHIYQRK